MKRFFDLSLAIIFVIVLTIPMLLIAIVIKCTSKGPVLHWSDRVGQKNIIFKMPKFRSMKTNTPLIESALMTNSKEFITPIGPLLRRTSIDELPQLFSILKGDMSFVGHRPILPKHNDLSTLRTQYGIDKMVPGLTGWAQINGRDMLSVQEKVALEIEYKKKYSLWFDIKILYISFFKVLKGEDIIH